MGTLGDKHTGIGMTSDRTRARIAGQGGIEQIANGLAKNWIPAFAGMTLL